MERRSDEVEFALHNWHVHHFYVMVPTFIHVSSWSMEASERI